MGVSLWLAWAWLCPEQFIGTLLFHLKYEHIADLRLGMCSGRVCVGDTLLLGPVVDAKNLVGGFPSVVVRSIHSKRVPQSSVCAGTSASLALELNDSSRKVCWLRRAMVLC